MALVFVTVFRLNSNSPLQPPAMTLSRLNDAVLSKKIKLKSADNKEFEVENTVAFQSPKLKQMIEDDSTGNAISVPDVSGKILARILEYCQKHAGEENQPSSLTDLKKWDESFLKSDESFLYDLLLAADFLKMKGLIDLVCKAVAQLITGKSTREIRKILHIVNDFTPEEEEEARREIEWALL